MASQSDAEIKLYLDPEKGWCIEIVTLSGPQRRMLAQAAIDPDIALMIANGIDQLVPQLALNSEQATVVYVVSAATHKAVSSLGERERVAASALADIRQQREKFATTLARVNPVATRS